MTENTNGRNILHELCDAVALLGDEYETASVDCEPGDTAIRITKQGSTRTIYIIAYIDPDDTEIHLYSGPDSLVSYFVLYNGSLNDFTPEDIADYIIRSL